MQEDLEALLRHVDVPNAERPEALWAEYVSKEVHSILSLLSSKENRS